MKAQLLIPSYSGRVHYSLLKAVGMSAGAGRVAWMTVSPGCSVLPLARALLVDSVVEDADVVLMIDDDTILPLTGIELLLDSWEVLKGIDPEAVALTAVIEGRNKSFPSADIFSRVPGKLLRGQGYELRERVGLGATAVDGKTLRRLTSDAPRIRFNGESYPNLFPFRDVGGEFIGEDYAFSMALGEAGNMYVDTRLHFGHAARW